MEQRTNVRQMIRAANPRAVQNVNFALNVGVAVPETVALEPLPTTIVQFVPAWRGYMFFLLADGRIVVVEPGSHRIVDIILA
ncbi:MAG: DUF1236 domain-containing protein [Bauldia sp.]